MVIMKNKISIFLSTMVFASALSASELVYTPINPSFGGSPLNGSFLLSKAQAQNKHKAKISEKTYAEKFQDSLERAYINKMVREITDLAFGETCDVGTPECEQSIFGEDATFVSGDYRIEIITSSSDSITVQITHSITGEITIIEVPKFGNEYD
ncbi:curli assembly protein CsgF [Thalassotalea fusca]